MSHAPPAAVAAAARDTTQRSERCDEGRARARAPRPRPAPSRARLCVVCVRARVPESASRDVPHAHGLKQHTNNTRLMRAGRGLRGRGELVIVCCWHVHVPLALLAHQRSRHSHLATTAQEAAAACCAVSLGDAPPSGRAARVEPVPAAACHSSQRFAGAHSAASARAVRRRGSATSRETSAARLRPAKGGGEGGETTAIGGGRRLDVGCSCCSGR